ncbi:hypothetical protein JCM30471_22460 [Desulfuromonas carbonis]
MNGHPIRPAVTADEKAAPVGAAFCARGRDELAGNLPGTDAAGVDVNEVGIGVVADAAAVK